MLDDGIAGWLRLRGPVHHRQPDGEHGANDDDDGQAVRVSSRRGTIVLRTHVTQRTTVGVVFISFHFAEAAANLLTIDALDPLAKIPEHRVWAVRVMPASERELTPPRADLVSRP